MKKNKLEWHNEKRKLKDLIPYESNPRQITQKEREDLIKSLDKFSLAEIPAINLNNKIAAGHQRYNILLEKFGGDYEIDVRVPNRELTEKEFQEYNIRSNKNVATWDFDVLANNFELQDLTAWGFEDWQLGISNIDTDKFFSDEPGSQREPGKTKCPNCGEEF